MTTCRSRPGATPWYALLSPSAGPRVGHVGRRCPGLRTASAGWMYARAASPPSSSFSGREAPREAAAPSSPSVRLATDTRTLAVSTSASSFTDRRLQSAHLCLHLHVVPALHHLHQSYPPPPIPPASATPTRAPGPAHNPHLCLRSRTAGSYPRVHRWSWMRVRDDPQPGGVGWTRQRGASR